MTLTKDGKTANREQVATGPKGQELKLSTEAWHAMAITVFNSQMASFKGVCIIVAATGVAQYLYQDFTIWLIAKGYHAVTFDYASIGLSINGHVNNAKVMCLAGQITVLLGYLMRSSSNSPT